ncbi:MAG TPA: hypothetical protein VFC47_00080 [Caulobacteraceae bacterium]|nr:hypothetical protein [Caulobacteraceae bacterium]
MSDNETEKTPAAVPPAAAPVEAEVRKAKVGVKDAGEIVGTFGGEKVDGRLADIADGD